MGNQKLSEDFLAELRSDVFSHIKKADYQKALKLCQYHLKKYGSHRFLLHSYAAVLGDYAEFTSQEKKLKKESCQIYRPLLKRLSGLSEDYKHNIRNEYYYHSYQFKKQFLLGWKNKKVKDDKRLYSMGVGAANYSYQLKLKGHTKRSHQWAEKAIGIWRKFFLIDKKYYNPYVHLALAWGTLENIEKMENNLNLASQYSGQPLKFEEFEAVRRKISKLKRYL
jgi:hypothetical protein